MQVEIDPLIDIYFVEIADCVGLSSEEERMLCARIQDGDEAAVGELVRANLRFVVRVAKQYKGMGLPFADLINEGNLGMVTAAQRFDGALGYRFISYAVWWVRHAILKALAEQARLVRLPNNRVVGLARLMRVNEVLEHELGRTPVVQELAQRLEMPCDELGNLVNLDDPTRSLDQPLNALEERLLGDVIADDQPALDEGYMRAEMKQVIERALEHLAATETLVLSMYFGLGEHQPMTLEQIGRRLGRTRERVRQIKVKALHKLRSSRNGRLLGAYLHDD